MKGKNSADIHPVVFLDKHGEEPFTTSDIIAEHSGNKHETVQRLIRKYENDFQDFGKVGFEIRPLPDSKTGQSIKVYHLNEEQATLLLTYLKNTPKVRAFKKELVRQFYEMRRLLQERQTAQWQQARAEGKAVRRLETDAVKAFAEYAAANGSNHPEQYYIHFTRLAHKAVGIADGQREQLSTAQLLNLQMSEQVIDRAIWSELARDTEYHAAFRNVKEKVQQLTALAFSPRQTPRAALH